VGESAGRSRRADADAFIDVASSDQPPALAALQPNYLAVYTPDPSITTAWGYPFEDSREERPGQREREDWQPDSFKSVRRNAALASTTARPFGKAPAQRRLTWRL